MGVILYHDMKTIIKPFEFPKISFKTRNTISTAPMMLIEGNWSCQSTLSEYKINQVISEMSEDSQWWEDCHPLKKCRIMNTWMGEEYDENNIKSNHRYLKYNYQEVIQSIIKTEGHNSNPIVPDPIPISIWNNKQISNTHCMAQFKFRNVLTGEYYIESTVNNGVIISLMKYINELFEITYFNKCQFEYYHIFDKAHCIIKLKPLNITSYDSHKH